MVETLDRVVVLERHTRPALVEDAVMPARPVRKPAAQRWLVGVLLRAAIALPLLALALVLIVSGLMPAVFVALVAFWPALAPLVFVGFGILATAGLKMPEEDRICDPNQPCCCGRHGHERSQPEFSV